ncbi:hypothetical protein OEZ86_008370 [Tetradesmus obliquus]|nr:hypothetical protein OEZ86_008370 [Tetradesmus obliquus]
MGKKPAQRPNEAKYGMALYGAAWPEGEYFFVCGGGGHGLVNRIVWGRYRDGRCSDQLGDYKLGKETPMRMLICPWGSSLLVGNANGGIRRLQIGSDDSAEHKPKLVEVSAAFQESLAGIPGEVAAMRFNSRGNMLAVSFRENSTVKVIAYPSMKELVAWKLDDPEVKDVDFCPHTAAAAILQQQQQQQPSGAELLATVGGNGVCRVWEVRANQQQLVATLEPPKDKAKCVFARCCWARSGQPLLFALVNYRMGKDLGSYLVAYGPPEGPGKPWPLLKKVKANNSPASAMDISKHGEWIAAGYSDGMLRVYHSDTLMMKSEAMASIAFVSSVSFNADNSAVIAVGGDANCYVMETVARREAGIGAAVRSLLLFLLLCLAAAALLHFYQHPEALPYTALQYLQQYHKRPDIVQRCSSSEGALPLQPQACEWLQRAAEVLPDELYRQQHDEL